MESKMYKCEFCSKEFKTTQARGGHRSRSHINVDKQKINAGKGTYARTSPWPRHSDETKDRLSLLACERLAKHSKYTQNVEYTPGVILESSFEARTAKILDELEVRWEKVRRGYTWDDNGKKRRYIPDFYLPEYDIFLDPKNDYLIKKDKVKIESAMALNNIVVYVLSDKQINKDYIITLL